MERSDFPLSCAKWDELIVVFIAFIVIFCPISQNSSLKMGNSNRLTNLRKLRRIKLLITMDMRAKIVSFLKFRNAT